MGTTTFHAKVKGYGRKPIVLAQRVQDGEKIDYRWRKPAHVIEAIRKENPTMISMEGAGVRPFRDFAELAVEVDRCEKNRASAAREFGPLVRWCAEKWGTCRNEAWCILFRLSDATVLDHARAFVADTRTVLS